MELIEGKIGRLTEAPSLMVRSSIVATSHAAIFEINGIRMIRTGRLPFLCQEGDQVVCVGQRKMGAFQVYAYKDRRTNAVGRESAGTMLVIGALFAIAGLTALGFGLVSLVALPNPGLAGGIRSSPPLTAPFPILVLGAIGLVFAIVGSMCFSVGWRYARAARMVAKA
jgi:hypothetical protein